MISVLTLLGGEKTVLTKCSSVYIFILHLHICISLDTIGTSRLAIISSPILSDRLVPSFLNRRLVDCRDQKVQRSIDSVDIEGLDERFSFCLKKGNNFVNE